MKGFLVCLVALLLAHWLTPFWGWAMLVPFGYALVWAPEVGRAAVIGAASAGGVWLVAALVLYLTGSELVATRVAAMVGVGVPLLLVLATGLVAAVAGALAGSAGAALRAAMRRPIVQ